MQVGCRVAPLQRVGRLARRADHERNEGCILIAPQRHSQHGQRDRANCQGNNKMEIHLPCSQSFLVMFRNGFDMKTVCTFKKADDASTGHGRRAALIIGEACLSSLRAKRSSR